MRGPKAVLSPIKRRRTLFGNGRSPMATSSAPPAAAVPANRWLQLVLGVACMVAAANIQYSWTLFVPEIQKTFGWDRAAIQVAFTIFVVVQTWLTPIEGYFIDKYGPSRVVMFGGLMTRACLGHQLLRHHAHRLLYRLGGGRYRCGLCLRHLHQQRPEVVPRQARPRGRSHGGWLRRWLGPDDHPNRQHDLTGQLRPRPSSCSA